MEKPPREGGLLKSSLSAIINKRIRDGVIGEKPKRDSQSQQKTELYQRLHSNCTKLNEGDVKAGVRMHTWTNKLKEESLLCSGPH